MNSARIKGNNKIVKSIDLFRKIGDTIGTLYANMGTIKDRKIKDKQKQMRLRRGRKNAQKNYTKMVIMTQIEMMLGSLM